MDQSTLLVLVINCGSSSLKYEVYGMPDGHSLGKGVVERIGQKTGGNLHQFGGRGELQVDAAIPDHATAMELIRKALTDSSRGILTGLADIKGVGHRVVHGGEKYAASVIINDDVLAAIEDCSQLAPLHNPANLMGIRESIKLFPTARQVAVFDTAFHQTMAPAAFLYGLPRQLYDKYRVRRYGFHGTSHRYVYYEAVRYLKRSSVNTNIITCHLGNGASITAVEKGKSIDTSMGFTPLEGLVMGTRCGDIDPQITLFLLNHGYTVDQIETMYNKQSGLLGLTNGLSNDMRDVAKAAAEGNQLAVDALDVYSRRIRRYIGAFMAEMVKSDAIVFTGGVGQFAAHMRERVCRGLENLGICMDYELNKKAISETSVISQPYSAVTILVIPTNEELQIAKDTHALMTGCIV